MCWDVTSNSPLYFLQQHITQFIFHLYPYICKLLSMPLQSANFLFLWKWNQRRVAITVWPCYNPILSTKLISHIETPFYFHLLLRHTIQPTLHQWMGSTCTISCLSDLCLSRAATRRLWHKNTDNWSVLDSQRSHQLFPVKAKQRKTNHQSLSRDEEPKMLHCFVFTFLLSLYSLSFPLSQTGNVTRRNVRKMSCLSLKPKANRFISLYRSLACVSLYTFIIRLKTSTSAQSHDLPTLDTDTHTHTFTGTYSMYTHMYTVQVNKGSETYTVKTHLYKLINTHGGFKCVRES